MPVIRGRWNYVWFCRETLGVKDLIYKLPEGFLFFKDAILSTGRDKVKDLGIWKQRDILIHCPKTWHRVKISCPETLRKNLLLEVTHKATGLHQKISKISSSFQCLLMILGGIIFVNQFYIALSINFGHAFFFLSL